MFIEKIPQKKCFDELDIIRFLKKQDLRFFLNDEIYNFLLRAGEPVEGLFFYFLSDWYNIWAIYSTNDKTDKYEKKNEKKVGCHGDGGHFVFF